jgi:hypothetical protein
MYAAYANATVPTTFAVAFAYFTVQCERY